MKKLFNLLLAGSIVLCAHAQKSITGTIYGSIKDGGNQKNIESASISLLSKKDSGVVKIAIADKEGKFIFEQVKEGGYLVLATAAGHAKTYSNTITISLDTTLVNAGVLQLTPLEKNLTGITVVAKKPFIERKIDRTIVNVDAAISNTGSTAMEILEKSPGVTVDKDGNISLKGKQGVIIMLDGKPAYLSGQELANYLRTMPSGNLDQIELITNPSAKYDASGTAGIINIKTKKNKQKGFNGSATSSYGQGFYARNNNSVNLNYRNGKFNVFSNLNASFDRNYQDLHIVRKFKNSNAVINRIFEQDALMKRSNRYASGKIGMDYNATKKTTLGLVLNMSTARHLQDGLNTTNFYNGAKVLDSVAVAKNDEASPWKNASVNFNMRHTFDSTGREITADADYVRFESGKAMSLLNKYFTSSGMQNGGDNLVGDLPTDINIYTFKMDYTHPFKKGIKLEAGIKTGYVNTDNTAGYFNVIGEVKHPDYTKTNRFQYKENINAAYINVSKEIKKWGLQGGLRVENTNNNGHQFGNPQIGGDSTFKNNYTGLFPNVFVSYKANDKNQWSFSYGRRIRRPDYEDLNPFLFFIDNYTYERGNPFLQPSLANTLEASHTYKDFLTTSVSYTHTKGLFAEVFEPNGSAIVITRRNFGSSNNASASVNAQIKATKWWMLIPYTELNYSNYEGMFPSGAVNVDATNFLINVTNQFTFKKGWSAELSGFYRTSGIEGQILIKPLGQINAGVQKQVLKNKGTVKVNVRDALRTMLPKGEIAMQTTEASFSQRRDSRVATLSFTYRFGKPIKGLQKRKTGGAGDEQNRVKGAQQ